MVKLEFALIEEWPFEVMIKPYGVGENMSRNGLQGEVLKVGS